MAKRRAWPRSVRVRAALLTLVFAVPMWTLGAVSLSTASARLGLAGEPGEFEAEFCDLRKEGRSAPLLHCTGTLTSYDGRTVGRGVEILWADGYAGARARVRIDPLSGGPVRVDEDAVGDLATAVMFVLWPFLVYPSAVWRMRRRGLDPEWGERWPDGGPVAPLGDRGP